MGSGDVLLVLNPPTTLFGLERRLDADTKRICKQNQGLHNGVRLPFTMRNPAHRQTAIYTNHPSIFTINNEQYVQKETTSPQKPPVSNDTIVGSYSRQTDVSPSEHLHRWSIVALPLGIPRGTTRCPPNQYPSCCPPANLPQVLKSQKPRNKTLPCPQSPCQTEWLIRSVKLTVVKQKRVRIFRYVKAIHNVSLKQFH